MVTRLCRLVASINTLTIITIYLILLSPFKRLIFVVSINFILYSCFLSFSPYALCSGEETLPPNLVEQQEPPGMSIITNTRPVLNGLGNLRTMGVLGYPMETISAVISTDPGPGLNFNSSAPWSPYHDTPVGAIFSVENDLSLLKIFARRYSSYVTSFCEARDHSLSFCSGDTSEIFDEAIALIANQDAGEQVTNESSEQALLELAFSQSMLPDLTSTSLANLSFEGNTNLSSANISSSSSRFDSASRSGDSSSVDLNDSGFLIREGIAAHKNYFIWVSKVLGVELDTNLLGPDLDSEEIARIDKIRALALSDAPLRDVLQYVNGGSLTRGPKPLPPGVGID